MIFKKFLKFAPPHILCGHASCTLISDSSQVNYISWGSTISNFKRIQLEMSPQGKIEIPMSWQAKRTTLVIATLGGNIATLGRKLEKMNIALGRGSAYDALSAFMKFRIHHCNFEILLLCKI